MGKSIYAMNQLDLGAWKDTRLLIDKWFLSFDWMKKYIPQALYGRAYLFKHKDLMLDCNLEVKYQESVKDDHETVGEGVSDKGGLFSWFGGQKVEARPQTPPKVLQWQSKEYHGSGLTIGLYHIAETFHKLSSFFMFGRTWGRGADSIPGTRLPHIG